MRQLKCEALSLSVLAVPQRKELTFIEAFLSIMSTKKYFNGLKALVFWGFFQAIDGSYPISLYFPFIERGKEKKREKRKVEKKKKMEKEEGKKERRKCGKEKREERERNKENK